jgi:hypothetical protein
MKIIYTDTLPRVRLFTPINFPEGARAVIGGVDHRNYMHLLRKEIRDVTIVHLLNAVPLPEQIVTLARSIEEILVKTRVYRNLRKDLLEGEEIDPLNYKRISELKVVHLLKSGLAEQALLLLLKG